MKQVPVGRRGRDGMVLGSTTICDKVCQLLATGRIARNDVYFAHLHI
jgi:hypothetical protein